MGRSKTIPDRWLDYTNVGGIVPGTRFIAFKVPLRESICARLPPHQRFTPNTLLERVYGLGLVIDLTCTNRYYDPISINQCGIVHAKIMCLGQQIPSESVVYEFFQAVDAFLMNPANDGKLIGVHCTHGVNRTGYLICKYMIDRLRIAPATAIEDFERSRGHRFDRDEYVSSLQGGGGDARAPFPVPASRPVAAHGGYGDHRGPPPPPSGQRDDFSNEATASTKETSKHPDGPPNLLLPSPKQQGDQSAQLHGPTKTGATATSSCPAITSADAGSSANEGRTTTTSGPRKFESCPALKRSELSHDGGDLGGLEQSFHERLRVTAAAVTTDNTRQSRPRHTNDTKEPPNNGSP